ncbi:MAG: transposase [bacterium]|nr:transposase [bacterium]
MFALRKVSEFFDISSVPVKSALSQYRQKISYIFFKEKFDKSSDEFQSKLQTYKGHHLIGFDGDDLNLPRTKDLLDKGYAGYSIDKEHETHYLKMYIVKCIDLMSNVVLDFRQSSKNDEIGLAIEMVSSFSKSMANKTIAIYDRLYFSKRMINAHIESGLIFIARCKTGTTFKEVVSFNKSNGRRISYDYYDKKNLKKIKIYLVKIINPKTKKPIVVATNLDISTWTNKEILNLYTLRWDCETNNRDSTSTMKLDQWHSEFFNGIMQEIYVHLIMMNITKMTIFLEGGYCINLDENTTKKANFKFMFSIIFDLIPKILKSKISSIILDIRNQIKLSSENRKRLFRSAPRQTKKRNKSYKNASVAKKGVLK